MKKIWYILICILSLILISVFIYEKNEPSRQMKKKAAIEASLKLKQTYSNLNSYLVNIDRFSDAYLRVYLPERDLICSKHSKQKDTHENKADLLNIIHNKMHVIDYELDFISNVIDGILETDDYTQDFNSPDELKVESDAEGLNPINHWKHIDANADKYMKKDQWDINLAEAIDYDFKMCILNSNQISEKYNKYNDMLKEDIKMHMKKIEEFYRKNDLDLDELKTNNLTPHGSKK